MSNEHPHLVAVWSPPAFVGDISPVVRRLSAHSQITAYDVAALQDILGRPVSLKAGRMIAIAGEPANMVTVVRQGFACRTSLLPDGRRQIQSVLITGDIIDAEAPMLALRPDNIEAITDCSAWLVHKNQFAGLTRTHPMLAEALARDVAIGAQVARQWVANIGQRTALERIAHLFCELYVRLDAVGLVQDGAFEQPLIQSDLADAQGLSAVHVNRVLQQLRQMNLLRTHRRTLTILDWPQLQALAMFDPLYLHLHPNSGTLY